MPAIGIREVAALAGVAVGTASEALNHPNRGAPGTVARVAAAARSLGYVPNAAARQLKVGRSFTLGLAVSELGRPFPLEAMSGVEDAADAAGYAVLFGISRDSADREARYLDLFERQRVDGVLFAPRRGNLNVLDPFRARNVPIVLIGSADHSSDFPSVAIDEIGGGRLAVEHLLSGGSRHIAFIGGADEGLGGTDREIGGRRAAGAGGGSFRALTVRGGDASDGHALVEAIRESDRSGERIDGVVCGDRAIARSVVETLRKARIRVPEDVSVLAFDDARADAGIPLALSTISTPQYEMGAVATRMLIDRLDRSGSPMAQLIMPVVHAGLTSRAA